MGVVILEYSQASKQYSQPLESLGFATGIKPAFSFGMLSAPTLSMNSVLQATSAGSRCYVGYRRSC
jgi:hypothetical protein